MIPNYYALLEISPSASQAEIKRAYRRLARLHHPDLNTQAQDEQIKRLNEAYAVLSDAKKRAAYDAQWRQHTEATHSKQKQKQREPKMTWAQGVAGFVRELKKEQEQPEPKMTWARGMGGFVRELKEGMRDD
jgi:curved DNA-binding protein CbpA